MALEMTPMSGSSAVEALATNEGNDEKSGFGAAGDVDGFDDDLSTG